MRFSFSVRAGRTGDSRSDSRALWTLTALIIYTFSVASLYGEVWRQDPRKVVPVEKATALFTVDSYVITSIVTQNARALLTRPHRLFDAAHCFPAEGSLALGEPIITMGILAIPAYLLGANPILTFNLVLIAMVLIAAMAMYLLVAEWSGVPAAGIVAGLLYAFHWTEVFRPTHAFASDTAWTVLSLLFSRRLFVHGRWRDALGLGASISLQIGASVYPLLASVILVLPYSVWLLMHHRRLLDRLLPLAFVFTVVAAVGAFVYAPYLELRDSGVLSPRGQQNFLLSAPGGFVAWLIPGLSLAVLAPLGMLAPRRWILSPITGDPRWALLAGALISTAVALGPDLTAITGGPDLYGALSSMLPVLDSIRLPWKSFQGVHIVSSFLAGLGCAALLPISSGASS